jgi:hypothetical protein
MAREKGLGRVEKTAWIHSNACSERSTLALSRIACGVHCSPLRTLYYILCISRQCQRHIPLTHSLLQLVVDISFRMSTFQERLKTLIGQRGYEPSMRRSLQSVVLQEAKRCVAPRFSSLRPFQRKVAFMGKNGVQGRARKSVANGLR